MPEIYLGIDAGSTTLKAAVFDGKTGRALAWRSERIPLRTGTDGRREQAPADLDRALAGAMAGLRKAAGRRWRELSGIGLAAQGGSAMIADAESGKSLTPMMLWNDARARTFLPEVIRRRPADFWRQTTWRNGPGHGLAKLLWFETHRPGTLVPGRKFVGAGEYLFFRLTGQWRQDPCHALQIGCFNVPKRRLDARLLNTAKQPLSIVAPLRNGHETHPLARRAARRFGLPAGVPVAGPYMDHEAGYLSALDLSERPLQCSLGTAWVGNFALPKNERWQSPTHLVLPALTGDGWLVVQPLLTGNTTWDWFLAAFMDRDIRKALTMTDALFRKALLPPPGLTALPWFNMQHPLFTGSHGAGGFFGMSPATSPSDMARALAAAMVYEMKWVFSHVIARGKADCLVLGGGAGRDPALQKIFVASFDGVPVHSVAEPDLIGARGSLHAFGTRAARGRAVKAPRPPVKLRKEIETDYARYLKLRDALYGRAPLGAPVTFGKRMKT